MKRLIRPLNKQERSDVAHRVQHELSNEPWELIVISQHGTKRLRELYSIVDLLLRWSRRETSK